MKPLKLSIKVSKLARPSSMTLQTSELRLYQPERKRTKIPVINTLSGSNWPYLFVIFINCQCTLSNGVGVVYNDIGSCIKGT